MCGEDREPESFEETLRAIARELGESVERMTRINVDEIAEAIGVDPDRAREWADSAGRWLRSRVEGIADEFATHEHPAGGEHAAEDQHAAARNRAPGAGEHAAPAGRPAPDQDPLRHAAPHPLDLPSDEQGLALAALDSGRWFVEPTSNTLAAHGEGPGPSDALGLVRELRARDWISADGQLTLAGRRALARWLESASAH